MFFGGVPRQRSVPSDDLSVLGLEDGEGISNIVAPLVELSNGKGILAGPVEKVHGLDVGFGEERADVVVFLGDSAAETRDLGGRVGDGGGDGHFVLLGLGHVEIFDAVEGALNIFKGFSALFSGEIGLKGGLFIHKESGKNLVHVDSTDVVIILFIDKVDKGHGLMVETKEADPFFKIHVLIFDLFDDGREHGFHFFLEHEHLRYFCVGILANNVLELCPLHFLAFIVEQSTLTFGCQALLADEGRFSAVGVDADHVALVTIDAVGAVFDWLAHSQEK